MQNAQFRAISGNREALGKTPQEALNSLTALLATDVSTPIVILPFNRGDIYFTQAQQDRLQELKGRQETLSESEEAELDALVEASFGASLARMQAVQPVKV